MRFSIHTLGCKVNQYESERIIDELKGSGWEHVDFASTADIYIINTCTVTAVANHKSRQLIRRAVKHNPEALVVVTGCYADSDREEIANIDGVGLILSNKDKDELPRRIAAKLGMDTLSSADRAGANRPLHTRSLIKVQDGCNNFCSYCIVPYARGDLWSRPEGEVIDEVSRLVAGGTQEVVLTGIHLGLYGAGGSADLGSLLAKLIEIRGLGRVRLSSIELNEVTPAIVELIAGSGKICNHLHIPLQSGSNDVLARMNRHYTAEAFIERTAELKRRIPNLALTTDVIVGFPGETERDFEGSARLIETVGFSKLHVFKFSPRKGTPAAGFSDQIPNDIKDARSASLLGRGANLAERFAANYVGKDLSVLVERRQGNYLSGVSDNYIRVSFEGPDDIIGLITTVSITRQEQAALYGKSSE
ncbi:MAG: tRNA (N(6)-L-threonylcarbamoyladenosine(37)-C(2))-methylthiotransferase MtaB [Candidatus Aquicultor sp.]